MKDLNNLKSKILDSHENNLLNPDILHYKYLEAIVVSGLKGTYQLIVFALLSLINFCCNLILTTFPIHKQLPS